MNSAEAVVDSVLETRRRELSKIEAEIAAERANARTIDEAEIWDGVLGADSVPYDDEEYRWDRLRRLQQQIAVLEEVKDLLEKQPAETKANFLDIKQRDERSSKQNLWLTITTSGISLILGWLLSLLGSPATLVHAFGR